MRREQNTVAKLVELVLYECAVEPTAQRRISDPGMLRADVIRHLVLNDLDTHRVRSLDQLAQYHEIAEVIFDSVIVDRVIAVIVGVWAPRFIATVYGVRVVVPG